MGTRRRKERKNELELGARLYGAPGAYSDTMLFNAAGALVMAGVVPDLPAGVARAAEAIDAGRARDALDRLAGATQKLGKENR